MQSGVNCAITPQGKVCGSGGGLQDCLSDRMGNLLFLIFYLLTYFIFFYFLADLLSLITRFVFDLHIYLFLLCASFISFIIPLLFDHLHFYSKY